MATQYKKQKLLPAANPVSITSSPTHDNALSPLAGPLLTAAFADNFDLVRELVAQGADCFLQSEEEGWSCLHAAAANGNTEMVSFLLRKGNAVWNLVDKLGHTAGDVAYSMNYPVTYQLLVDEGVRVEMLKAAMGALFAADSDDDEEDMEEAEGAAEVKKSTASDNKTFLSSKLLFTKDSTGQEVCLDAEGNGVMMGWERGIMEETARRCCEPTFGKPGERDTIKVEEREEMNVLNIGFGLGIIDTFFQSYSPTHHLIIEPHPDVLAFAKSNGWYNKPGVRFYEGTWASYLSDLTSGLEPYVSFDVIYFDTYSEHYPSLHTFFSSLPDLLRSPESTFSFFHGLGATSRYFYDLYTIVVELHLREIGLSVDWGTVDVQVGEKEGRERWEGTAEGKVYWNSEVGECRVPVARLGL